MKIQKDKNDLLTIFNENIPQTKEYAYNAGGYAFSDFDRWIIVLHKKERKIVNLKNLGDNMSVVYMKDKKISSKDDKGGMNEAMRLFQWFDESAGKKYYFIPGLGDAQQQEKNILLKKLWTKYTIQKTAKGMMIEWMEWENKIQSSEEILGYLFGLFIMYGKFDAKKWELAAVKIQIPLFGQYLAHQEILDKMIKTLQQAWIFLKADKLPNKNGIVYQISSNDYELLEIFAHRYEPVEKFGKITKREFTEEMKARLIEFISTNTEIPTDGKAEVLKQLKGWTIKLLTK